MTLQQHDKGELPHNWVGLFFDGKSVSGESFFFNNVVNTMAQQQTGLVALQTVLNYMAFTRRHLMHFIHGLSEQAKLELYPDIKYLKDQVLHARKERFAARLRKLAHPTWRIDYDGYSEQGPRASSGDTYTITISFSPWQDSSEGFQGSLVQGDETRLRSLDFTQVQRILACDTFSVARTITQIQREQTQAFRDFLQPFKDVAHADWRCKEDPPTYWSATFKLNSNEQIQIELSMFTTSNTPYYLFVRAWKYPNKVVTSRLEWLTVSQIKTLLSQPKARVRDTICTLLGPGPDKIEDIDMSLGELKKNRNVRAVRAYMRSRGLYGHLQ